jgi:hypothetical protein
VGGGGSGPGELIPEGTGGGASEGMGGGAAAVFDRAPDGMGAGGGAAAALNGTGGGTAAELNEGGGTDERSGADGTGGVGGGSAALLGGGGGGAMTPMSVLGGAGAAAAGFLDRLSKTSRSEPPWSLILGESPRRGLGPLSLAIGSFRCCVPISRKGAVRAGRCKAASRAGCRRQSESPMDRHRNFDRDRIHGSQELGESHSPHKNGVSI